jgi:hypothetical protein
MEDILRKELLRPAEVANLCGVTRNTIYRWLRRKVFVPILIGGCTYIRGRDLRAHLNANPDLCDQPEVGSEGELEQEAQEMVLKFRDRR